MDIVDRIKALIELYDEYGSEMPEGEINFLKLLVTKAVKGGLVTEQLTPDEISNINYLYKKYSQIEAFDSEEGQGEGRG